jgi:AcrR family transcriptional regulator
MNAPPPNPVMERILNAADQLFYREGIQAVGVDALAAAANVSKRTLYKHFASKDALIVAYLLRQAARMTALDGPPLQQILGVFDGLERVLGGRSFRGCPYVNAVAELGGDPAHPAMAVVKDIKLGRRDWFETRLRTLNATDPARLADQMALLVDGAITTSMVRGGDPQAAVSARAAALVLLKDAGVHTAASTPLPAKHSPSTSHS